MKTLESEMKRCDLKTKTAEIFHEALDLRKNLLFDHPMMLCAVYLDPRIRFFLGPNEIQIAKMKLYELYERMETLKEENCNESNKSVPIDSFEEFVKSQVHEPEDELTKLDRCAFLLLLESFETMFPSISHRRNIHEFWETEKNNFPVIYELAAIINAVPPTQTSVERAFSTLGFVFDCRRTRISEEILEHILTIKLNHNLFDEINDEERKGIDNPDIPDSKYYFRNDDE